MLHQQTSTPVLKKHMYPKTPLFEEHLLRFQTSPERALTVRMTVAYLQKAGVLLPRVSRHSRNIKVDTNAVMLVQS